MSTRQRTNDRSNWFSHGKTENSPTDCTKNGVLGLCLSFFFKRQRRSSLSARASVGSGARVVNPAFGNGSDVVHFPPVVVGTAICREPHPRPAGVLAPRGRVAPGRHLSLVPDNLNCGRGEAASAARRIRMSCHNVGYCRCRRADPSGNLDLSDAGQFCTQRAIN